MAELIKLHSLPGPDMYEFPTGARHFNDFLAHGNSAYIASVGGTKWIKLWVSWFRMQNYSQPSNIWTSWDRLRAAGGPNGNYFDRVDEQIKAVNDAGYAVILQVDENFPLWCNTYNRARCAQDEACSAANPNKHAYRCFPDSVAADSPWGWWISYLLCRYKMGVPANPTGPAQTNLYGNPRGAWVYGLEFCNEPNLLNWPASESACWTAEMFKTIEYLTAFHWPYSSGFGGVILGPGTSDTSNNSAVHYDAFTKAVLSYLPAGWQPRVYLGWSHHNYGDIDRTTGSSGVDGIKRVRSRLMGGSGSDTNTPWRNGDRTVYITEGAARHSVAANPQDLTTAQETAQVYSTAGTFRAVRELHLATGAFPLYAQHAIQDTPYNTTKFAPHRNFKTANGAWAPGDPRPLASTWRALPI